MPNVSYAITTIWVTTGGFGQPDCPFGEHDGIGQIVVVLVENGLGAVRQGQLASGRQRRQQLDGSLIGGSGFLHLAGGGQRRTKNGQVHSLPEWIACLTPGVAGLSP